MIRSAYTLRSDDDDFGQAGALVRNAFDDAQRTRLVETLVGQYVGLKHARVRERFLWYWNNIDPGIAERVRGQVVLPVAAT